jgi:hypothetical protein
MMTPHWLRASSGAVDCPRESDVLDAIASHRWPERADEELRAHVTTCAVCSDVANVAAAFAHDLEVAAAEARPLPSADLVWFRAQARAKAEASRQAARPIAVMQAIGFACAAGVISVLIGLAAFWVWTQAEWLQTLPDLQLVWLDSMSLAVRGTLLAIGLWLILAPVAVYLVASDD